MALALGGVQGSGRIHVACVATAIEQVFASADTELRDACAWRLRALF